MDKGKCKACGAPIMWARRTDNNRAIPLNVRPTTIWFEQPDARVYHVTGRMAHHVTCPHAKEFRRKQIKQKGNVW